MSKINESLREDFATFLTALAAGHLDKENWSRFVIEHYHDTLLESVRVRLVRLEIEPENPSTFPGVHAEQLRAWADELRRDHHRFS
jgi:hypothetical protein